MLKFSFKESDRSSEIRNVKSGVTPEYEELLRGEVELVNAHNETLSARKLRYYRHYEFSDIDLEKLVKKVEENYEQLGETNHAQPMPQTRDCPHKVVICISVEEVSIHLVSTDKDKNCREQVRRALFKNYLEVTKMSAMEFYGLIAKECRAFFVDAGILTFLVTQNCKAAVTLITEHNLMNRAGPAIDILKCADGQASVVQGDPICGVDLVDVLNYQLKINDTPAEVEKVMTCAQAALCASAHLGISPAPIAALSIGGGVQISCAVAGAGVGQFEAANFGFDTIREFFCPCIVDHCYDFNHCATRGRNSLERMISGNAMVSLLRMTMVRIFRSQAPYFLYKTKSITVSCLLQAAFETGDTATRRIVGALIKDDDLGLFDNIVEVFQNLSRILIKRTCSILAGVIVGLGVASDRCHEAYGINTVLVDGEFFAKQPELVLMLEQRLNDLLRNNKDVGAIRIMVAENAAIRGAAIKGHSVSRRPDFLL